MAVSGPEAGRGSGADAAREVTATVRGAVAGAAAGKGDGIARKEAAEPEAGEEGRGWIDSNNNQREA